MAAPALSLVTEQDALTRLLKEAHMEAQDLAIRADMDGRFETRKKYNAIRTALLDLLQLADPSDAYAG